MFDSGSIWVSKCSFHDKEKKSSSDDLLTKDVLGFEISLIAHLLTVMNIVTYKSQHEFKIFGSDGYKPI